MIDLKDSYFQEKAVETVAQMLIASAAAGISHNAMTGRLFGEAVNAAFKAASQEERLTGEAGGTTTPLRQCVNAT